MTVYGIGSFYFGINKDLSKEFHDKGIIAIGYDEDEKPYYHGLFNSIENGDIVLLKTVRNKQDLIIRGIGIVNDNTIFDDDNYGSCMKVDWLDFNHDGLFEKELSGDGGVQRGTTIYKEFNKEYIADVINHLKNITT